MTMFVNRRRLVSRPVVTGVPAVIGAVVLAVVLSGCGDRTADQASPSSPSAAPSPSSQAPAGQGPYKVAATVPVEGGAYHLAVDPGTHTVYVATGRMCGNRGYCTGDGAVSVIDGATRTVTATVPLPVGEGQHPFDVAVDPSTHTVYVTYESNDMMSVIDGATRTVTATVPLGQGADTYVHELAVDPGTVYVGDGMVSVIERQS